MEINFIGLMITIQLLIGVSIVNTFKLVTRFLMDLARMSQHCSFPTWMPFLNASSIVYLPVDHNPAIVLFVMFLNLSSCKLLLRGPGILLGI